MFPNVISIALGLLVSLLLGLGTHNLLKAVRIEPVDPAWPNAGDLKNATDFTGRSGAGTLGYLERTFFYAALVIGANAAIAAWLAFKVATKWAAWQHIVGLPSIPGLLDHPIQTLRYRNALGTWMVSRTLIGTLYNILCGLGGVIAWKVMFSWLY